MYQETLQQNDKEFSALDLKDVLIPQGSLSYVKGLISEPLLTETTNDFLMRTVRAYGDRPAAVFCQEGIRWTWAELAEKVNQLAKGFLEIGVEKGDRVGIWAPNRPEWLLTQFAAAQVGAILVNLNPANEVEELKHAINKVGMKFLVCAESAKNNNLLDVITDIVPEISQSTPGHLHAVNIPTLKSVICMSDEVRPGIMRFRDVVSLGEQVTAPELKQRELVVGFKDPVNIQFTSGTTGKPKAATLTHYNILNNAKSVAMAMNFTENDKLCIPVPLFHCFGMVMSVLVCAHSGACMVFPSQNYDAEKVMAAVSTEKCTALHGVPRMFISQLNHPNFKNYDFSSLRTGIMAGAPCPIETMKKVVSEMHMSEVTIAYGMTETSPVSLQSNVSDPIDRRVTTVGRVGPHIEVKIVDEKGEIVPVGVAGELCTRGYSVMQGYWGDEEKSEEVIRDGWMKTGDLATIDAEGYCNIVGRNKDMINCNGEKFFPREIEDFILTHPKVADVQVFGVPDSLKGEMICAWIIPKPSTTISKQEIKAHFDQRISIQKLPHHIEIVEEFPQTLSGKPQKFAMRAQMIAQLGIREVKTA
jgi:fatty-acyl-CoA synthase